MAERPLQRGYAKQAYVEYLVRPLHDRGELLAMLTPHRPYAAYAIGQLQPHLFPRSEWWVARGAQGQALLLSSHGGLGDALFALGPADSLEAILRLHPGPRHAFLTCQPHQLETVKRYYILPEAYDMSRMRVGRETFTPMTGEARPFQGRARRLAGRDVRRVNRLYRSDGTPAFYTAQNIDDAVYYGAFDEDRLVAVAGTHVVSQPEGIGVIGNVFTHPRYRRQGLGTLVTSAVTRELLTSGREAVLSVEPSNEAAVRTYRRLGFREVARIIEGPSVRRDLGIRAFVRRRVAARRGRRYGAELVHLPA